MSWSGQLAGAAGTCWVARVVDEGGVGGGGLLTEEEMEAQQKWLQWDGFNFDSKLRTYTFSFLFDTLTGMLLIIQKSYKQKV